MAENLHFEEVFSVPVEKVFAYFANMDKLAGLWGGKWTRLTPGTTPDNPDGLGATRELKAGAFKWQERVTAYEPGRLIEYRIISGAPVKEHVARIKFAADPKGTRVTYDVDYEPKSALTGNMFSSTLRLAWTVGIKKVLRELQGP